MFRLFSSATLKGQNTSYNQFWNEFQFTHPVAEKYSVEADLANSFSNSPSDHSIFSTHTQFAATLQLHYYHSANWRFSLLSAYFSNYYVPEIGQRQYPEMRVTGQAVYFFNKIGYILQTRTRLEYRMIQSTSGNFENVFRYRQQIKYTQPFNSKYIRQGTYFGFISDEVFFKQPSTITGDQIFDRNDITLGFGYAVNDNIQIDVDYTFQYLPREAGSELYHAIQLNLNFNNPFQELKKTVKK